MKSIISRRELLGVLGTGTVLLGIGAVGAAAGSASEPTVKIGPSAAPASPPAGPGTATGPTATTRKVADALKRVLPFSDRQDFEDAKRGFIGTVRDLAIKTPDGRVAWNLSGYKFLRAQEAPAAVNPSLWRQAQLNMNNGLYKVVDRIYQVRGFDLSNMTIIEGDTGIILIDPLTTFETARAALDLYYQHRPKTPVVAVIYTHSHADHFGGVKGVVSEHDVEAGKVKIFAPQGFLEAAIAENILAGNAMSRRAVYMYGALLPKSERGQVDAGLGKTIPFGTVTLIPPTDSITNTGEEKVIDGVQIKFQMAPNTEAPVEMMFYFPQFKALCTAEDITHTLHNLYTLRGAEVRDARAWWKAINQTIDLFGHEAQVAFASHHWPRWGNEHVLTYLKKQRNLYKYINDQSLRLMNQGYTMTEVAEIIHLPKSIGDEWYNRGYYGTLNHNAKGVYQKYLGWYDSNPANLHPLTPADAAKHYIDYMGGSRAVIAKAREDFKNGNYRWVAEVMNKVVFAEPDNQEAKNLEADAFEQLGYQSESGPWRNEYLMGAYELRKGIPKVPAVKSAGPDTIKAMTLDMYFDYMGVRLNGPRADGKTVSLEWIFTDVRQQYAVELEDSVLVYTPNRQLPNADATIRLTRATLDEITLGKTTFEDAIASGQIKLTGRTDKFGELFGLLDSFNPVFEIVTPGRSQRSWSGPGLSATSGEEISPWEAE